MAVTRIGETPGEGKYVCMFCGEEVNLGDGVEMKPCQKCKNAMFFKP